MLKVLFILPLVILAVTLLGYWNYRQICRSAEKMMRHFPNKRGLDESATPNRTNW